MAVRPTLDDVVAETLRPATLAPVPLSGTGSVPNTPPPITQGLVWTVAQWDNAWQQKLDTTGGTISGDLQIDGILTLQNGAPLSLRSVAEWLTPGQPDGTTGNTLQIQAAIDAAAGVVGGNRAAAPGAFALVIPANVNAYILDAGGLRVPSNSHIIIEHGATLRVQAGTAANGFFMEANTSNILIDLYGTLDGNVINGVLAPCGGIDNNGLCSNLYVRGHRQGLITNWLYWGVNLVMCTNAEVSGVTITNCGASSGFAGISSQTNVTATGSSYTSSTGATVLQTTAAHNISPGQTFTYVGTTGNIPFSRLFGEYVAGPGTAGTTVNFTGPAGLGSVVINGGSDTSRVGTCIKCYNVGFTDCIIDGIQDLGLVLYGGCVGGYIRNCEVRYCSGPFIFSDNSQPGSNWDCVISDCYTHHNTLGPTITSNAAIPAHRSKVYNNIACYNYGSGMNVARADGAEVYGNLLHDNTPAPFLLSNSTTHTCANMHLGGEAGVTIRDNTIKDPGPAGISATNSSIAGGTYNTSTGAVSLTTKAAHNIPVDATFYIQVIRGTGALSSIRGLQVATAGTAGTTLNYMAAPNLGPMTFFDGTLSYIAPWPANNTIVSGTYDSPSGNVTLTTYSPHGLSPGNSFVLTGLSGTGAYYNINGWQVPIAGTTGNTIVFTEVAGMAAMTITGGQVLPPNFGIWIEPQSYISSQTSTNLRIFDNVIADLQSPANLTAAIGGTWGNNGYSGGNVYGNRLSIAADLSVYNPGISGSVQEGPSEDNRFQVQVGNFSFQGTPTFQGWGSSGQPTAQMLQPSGLAPSYNLSSGQGEVNFFVGRGAGQPGGFNFIHVAPIIVTGGNYTSGTGAVSITTGAPHNLLQGSSFTITGVSNSSPGSHTLQGSQIAGTGTTGTTVTYNVTGGLTLQGPITGGTIQPAGAPAISIASGTYNTGTGLVTLTTSVAHGMSPGSAFSVLSIFDGDPAVGSLNGTHTATSGTTGNTLNYTVATGLAISFPLSGGTVVQTGYAGGVIDTGKGINGILLANDGWGNTVLGGGLVHGSLQSVTLANGGTVTVNPNTSFVAIRNSSSIATGTIILPTTSALSHPYRFGFNELEINFQNPVTALTVTPATGMTVTNAPTTIPTAGNSVNFIQISPTAWIRRIAI